MLYEVITLYNIGYEGMMAEEIYPLVKENDEQQPHDEHLYGTESQGSAESGHANAPQPNTADDAGDSGGTGAGQGAAAAPPEPLSEARNNFV